MASLVINIFGIIKFNFSKAFLLLLLLLFVSFEVVAQSSNPFELGRDSSKAIENNEQNTKNVFEVHNSKMTDDNDSNPFEISQPQQIHSEENKNTTKNKLNSSNRVKQLANNPFDINEKSSSEKIVETTEVKEQNFKAQVKKNKEFYTGNNDFLLWAFLFILVLMALLMTTNRQLVLKIFKTVWFYNLTNILFRNFGSREMLFYGLIYINFIVNLGMYFYLGISHYYGYSGSFIFMMFVTLVLVVYLIKHLSLYVFDWVFPNLKKIKVYSFTTTIFNISLGISLIPINIVIAYGVPILIKIALVLGAIIIVVFYILRLLRGFLITIDYYNYSKFHYFLYLCALEFVPILFLYKFVLNFL